MYPHTFLPDSEDVPSPAVETSDARSQFSRIADADAPTHRPHKRSRPNNESKRLEEGSELDPMLSGKLEALSPPTYKVLNRGRVELSSQEDPVLPAGNKRTRDNRSRRSSRKERGFGATSRKRAIYRKAVRISTGLLSSALPHSTQGYIGSEGFAPSLPITHGLAPHQGPLPKNVRQEAQPRLIELCRRSYEVVNFSFG